MPSFSSSSFFSSFCLPCQACSSYFDDEDHHPLPSTPIPVVSYPMALRPRAELEETIQQVRIARPESSLAPSRSSPQTGSWKGKQRETEAKAGYASLRSSPNNSPYNTSSSSPPTAYHKWGFRSLRSQRDRSRSSQRQSSGIGLGFGIPNSTSNPALPIHQNPFLPRPGITLIPSSPSFIMEQKRPNVMPKADRQGRNGIGMESNGSPLLPMTPSLANSPMITITSPSPIKSRIHSKHKSLPPSSPSSSPDPLLQSSRFNASPTLPSPISSPSPSPSQSPRSRNRLSKSQIVDGWDLIQSKEVPLISTEEMDRLVNGQDQEGWDRSLRLRREREEMDTRNKRRVSLMI